MDEGGSWVRAVDNFIPQNNHDLGFRQGDEIRLIRFADENWGVGKLNGKQGIFPICFTEPISKSKPSSSNSNNKVKSSNQATTNQNTQNGHSNHVSPLEPEGPVPFGFGIVIDDTNLEIGLGDKVQVLGEAYKGSCWLVKRIGEKNENFETIQVNKRMIEITKLNWRRNTKPEVQIFETNNGTSGSIPTSAQQQLPVVTGFNSKPEVKVKKSEVKKSEVKTSVWKEPKTGSPKINKKSKARPKSYAEPSTLITSQLINSQQDETKRRSYQEATEGVWEQSIIDRIVQQDQTGSSNQNSTGSSMPKLLRNATNRKSLKDIFRTVGNIKGDKESKENKE